MPKYEYDCARCGPFADYRPVAEYDRPSACPGCGADAPRAALSFPAMSAAMAANARGEAANANRFQATSGHGTGCGCCGRKNFKIPRKDWVRKLT